MTVVAKVIAYSAFLGALNAAIWRVSLGSLSREDLKEPQRPVGLWRSAYRRSSLFFSVERQRGSEFAAILLVGYYVTLFGFLVGFVVLGLFGSFMTDAPKPLCLWWGVSGVVAWTVTWIGLDRLV